MHLCRKYEAQVTACEVRCDEATNAKKKMQRAEAKYHTRLAEVDETLASKTVELEAAFAEKQSGLDAQALENNAKSVQLVCFKALLL